MMSSDFLKSLQRLAKLLPDTKNYYSRAGDERSAVPAGV
jgi:hypothetical protein